MVADRPGEADQPDDHRGMGAVVQQPGAQAARCRRVVELRGDEWIDARHVGHRCESVAFVAGVRRRVG